AFENDVPVDAIELPAIVMAAAPDDAVNVAYLHACLKELLPQGGAAVPPDFHGFAWDRGRIQGQLRLDLEGFADLQRLQSAPQGRMQGTQEFFVGRQVFARNVREPGRESTSRFKNDRGILQSQPAGTVLGADVLDVDPALLVADAGVEI